MAAGCSQRAFGLLTTACHGNRAAHRTPGSFDPESGADRVRRDGHDWADPAACFAGIAAGGTCQCRAPAGAAAPIERKVRSTAGASSAAPWSSGGGIDTLSRTVSPPVNSPRKAKSLGNCHFFAVLIQVKALVADLWVLVLHAHQRGIRPSTPDIPGHSGVPAILT